MAFVCGGYEPAALVEKMGFCFFWPSKERVFNLVVNSTLVVLLIFPLIAAGAFPFPIAEKDQAEALHRDHESLKKTINRFE